MDLRALFTKMCAGGAGKHAGSGNDDSHTGNKNSKDTLSSSRLARGLKHAGLPLDRALVNLLVAAFSTSGAGRRAGRSRRHSSSSLSYADFHRMVHCDGLLTGGSAALEAGGGGGSRTLDEQVKKNRGADGERGGEDELKYIAESKVSWKERCFLGMAEIRGGSFQLLVKWTVSPMSHTTTRCGRNSNQVNSALALLSPFCRGRDGTRQVGYTFLRKGSAVSDDKQTTTRRAV